MEMSHEGKKYCWPISESELSYLYLNKKLSGEKIADLFNVTSGTIYYYRKKYNIKKLQAWERHDAPDKLSTEEKEVILGYLLGDGTLSVTSRYPHLRVAQCSGQKEFVKQVYKYLINWAAYNPVEDVRLDVRYNNYYRTYRFDTIAHPEFQSIYDLCYPKGIKTISSQWLDQINPLGLAMWYQGDGHNLGVMAKLNTDSFSYNEQLLIIEWLKNRYNMHAYIRRESKYNKLIISNGFEFGKIIKPYLIKFFNYKLPNKRMRNRRTANI